jgi:thymidylate kinase
MNLKRNQNEKGNNVFIIIEGNDLVGKSTIANEFKKQNPDYTFIETFPLKERFDKEWMKHIDYTAEVEYRLAKQMQSNNIIWDRFFISSIIYNQVYNRKYDVSYIHPEDFNNSLLIYVTIPQDVLKMRIKQRYEDEIILNRIFDLHQAYEDFFKTYSYPFLKLNGISDSAYNVGKIQTEIQKKK